MHGQERKHHATHEGSWTCGAHHDWTRGQYRHHEHHGQRWHHGAAACFGCTLFSNRFLRPYVMLLLAEEHIHGYELMGRLSDFGVEQGSMDPSVLYRTLRVLEMEGLATSNLDPSGTGPARKVYLLTDEGREVLSMWAAKLEDTCSYLTKFSERYKKLASD